MAEKGSKFFIVFFTDGEHTCGGDVQKNLIDFKTNLKELFFK